MAVIKVKPTSPGRRAVVKVVHKHYHAHDHYSAFTYRHFYDYTGTALSAANHTYVQCDSAFWCHCQLEFRRRRYRHRQPCNT